MSDERKTRYAAEIVKRQIQARERIGLSQAEMAGYLGIKNTTTYQRYETTTPIPHFLLELFCDKTGVSIFELITGRKQERVPKAGVGRLPSAAE